MAVHQSRAAADSAPHPHSGTLSRKPQRRSLRQAARGVTRIAIPIYAN